MDSMTEVLAQAVYGLNLNQLPLDNLAMGTQRPRIGSVGHAHQHASSQPEIAPPRLSSFSAIFEGPPSTGSSVSRKREQGKALEVPAGLESGGHGHLPARLETSGRAPLVRSVTCDDPRSPPAEKLADKRHSAPAPGPYVRNASYAGPSSVMPAISEDSSHRSQDDTCLSPLLEESESPPKTRHPVEPLPPLQQPPAPDPSQEEVKQLCASPVSPDPATLTTPYQPLINEEELSGGRVRREKSGGGTGEVIANLNTTSPTHSQEDMLHPSASTGSATPSQSSGGEGGGDTTPPRGSERSPDMEHRRLGGLFKHRSPEARRHDQNSVLEEGGKSRRKKKWFHSHRRSGSDVTGHMRMTGVTGVRREGSGREESPLLVVSGKQPAGRQAEGGVVSGSGGPSGVGSEDRRPFVLRKSSSDSNLQRLLRSHSLPTMSPSPTLLHRSLRDDDPKFFRRISSNGSAHPVPPESTGDVGVVTSTTSASVVGSTASHRPLRRSLTIDSPEPIPTGEP